MYRQAYLYFILALLIAVAGFYPSYFAHLPSTDLAHHFHGISATLWMLLLIVQSWLMRARRVAAHRMLGKLSIIVVIAFLMSGALMIHLMLTSSDPFLSHYGVRLAFLDVTTVLYFALAYGLALYYRREVQLHARFMASTALLVLPPALFRFLGNNVPGFDSFDMITNGTYGIVELVLLILIVVEWRAGKVRAPYPMLLALTVFQHVLVGRISDFSVWQSVVGWIRAF